MNVSIFGLGYVGLTAAACLAKQGHDVLGFDVSESKVAQINAGRCPISEPGLEDLVLSAVGAKSLRASQTIGRSLDDRDIAIVCVGTPSAPDGAHNMRFIAEVTRQIADALATSNRHAPITVVYRSTVRPGTMEELVLPIFKTKLGERITLVDLVYNPEFLRESVAISDFFSPPKIVLGTHQGKPSKTMTALNEGITAPVFLTGFREAEITKFVDNTFHALKVAFANEIGRVCCELGIEPKKVHEIFVSDTKLNISPYYLRPGGPFGGSCLPKDVRALQYLATDVGASTLVIDSIIRSNEAHKRFLFERCVDGLPAQAQVLLIGLAFKSHTDDLRESPNLDLARRLVQAGHKLAIYDPSIVPSRLIGQNLGYGLAHLPSVESLLVTLEDIQSMTFDLVIDTNEASASVNAACSTRLNIYAL